MTRFTIVLVIHIILCIQALRRIWHAQNENGIGWQAAWSFIVLLTPLLGPVMYFGMAAPPAEKPESERMRRRGPFRNALGSFSGLYDGFVTEKPPPAPPPKKPPPPDDGGDSRAGSAMPAAADSKSDLQREMEEARRLEQLERDRRRLREEKQ